MSLFSSIFGSSSAESITEDDRSSSGVQLPVPGWMDSMMGYLLPHPSMIICSFEPALNALTSGDNFKVTLEATRTVEDKIIDSAIGGTWYVYLRSQSGDTYFTERITECKFSEKREFSLLLSEVGNFDLYATINECRIVQFPLKIQVQPKLKLSESTSSQSSSTEERIATLLPVTQPKPPIPIQVEPPVVAEVKPEPSAVPLESSVTQVVQVDLSEVNFTPPRTKSESLIPQELTVLLNRLKQLKQQALQNPQEDLFRIEFLNLCRNTMLFYPQHVISIQVELGLKCS